jgi:uncharacterized protein YggT (Ycf19 family)
MLRLILKFVYTANTLVEALIMVRILLSVFAKNSTHTAVEWVNSMSEIFISPFIGIGPSVLVIDKFEISVTPVIALLFYAIAGFVLSELIKAFSSR